MANPDAPGQRKKRERDEATDGPSVSLRTDATKVYADAKGFAAGHQLQFQFASSPPGLGDGGHDTVNADGTCDFFTVKDNIPSGVTTVSVTVHDIADEAVRATASMGYSA